MYEKQGKFQNKDVFYSYYDDIEDVVKRVKIAPVSKLWSGEKEASQEKGRKDFCEFPTFEMALNKLEFGYDDHYKQFLGNFEKAKNIVSKITTTRLGGTKRDVAGFIPIVPNALLGLPESMINSSRTKRKIPTAKIYIEMSEACNVEPEAIINLKSVVFALIDLIERQGIRCEIWLTQNAYKGNEVVSDNIKLKDYFQPLNTYKLQFPIISPDMLRRIWFRLVETNKHLKNSYWTDTYGTVFVNEYSIKEVEKLLKLKETDIYIPNTRKLAVGENTSVDEIIKRLLEQTKLKNYIKFNK